VENQESGEGFGDRLLTGAVTFFAAAERGKKPCAVTNDTQIRHSQNVLTTKPAVITRRQQCPNPRSARSAATFMPTGAGHSRTLSGRARSIRSFARRTKSSAPPANAGSQEYPVVMFISVAHS